MRRRTFLRDAALSAAALAAPGIRLRAAPQADARFLLVFLRGGYDAANLLVPVSSDFYYESRPTIAIARPDALDPAAAVALDADWGLHPALRGTLMPLWQRGELAFVPFAGPDDLSRSHFETQDAIESGQPADGPRDFRSGFLNRLVDTLGGDAAERSVSFTDALPTAFKGTATVPNVSLRGASRALLDERQAALVAGMYDGHRLGPRVAAGLQMRRTVSREIEQDAGAAGRGAIAPRGFEAAARRVARLMRERYAIGFVDVGGWDSHVDEGGARGRLAGNLDDLGRGLAGFAQEMGPAWGRTVVLVMSEFGRTLRENGTRGTDHGHGTVAWLLGGAVRGARIAGPQVRVTRDTLDQDRDWPVLTEYRALLAGLFARLYGLSPARLDRVLPRAVPFDAGLV